MIKHEVPHTHTWFNQISDQKHNVGWFLLRWFVVLERILPPPIKFPTEYCHPKYSLWVRVRVWGWFKVSVGGNLLGDNLPGGSFPSTVP